MKELLTTCLLFLALPLMAQSDSVAVEAPKHLGDTTVVSHLDEVIVSSRRQFIRQEPDRIGYDVQADKGVQMMTVMELLSMMPLVTVDGQQNIQIRGSRNFRIYRNGHYDPALSMNAKSVFQTLPLSRVKRIEVITNPSITYNEEGVDAILNIVMIDSEPLKGISGVVDASYNTLNLPEISALLTGQVGNLVVSVDGGYSYMSRRAKEQKTDVYRYGMNPGESLVTRHEDFEPESEIYANVNASYDIDTLNLITASLGGYFHEQDEDNLTKLDLTDETLAMPYGYHYRDVMLDYHHRSWFGRIDYQHKTRRKGEQMTLSYMIAHTRQRTDENTIIEKQPTPALNYQTNEQNFRARFTEHTVQANWFRPLGGGHHIVGGAKFINRLSNTWNADLYKPFKEGADSYDTFEHTTRVWGVYADYFFQREKWSLSTGVLYEHSYFHGLHPDGKGETTKNRKGDWQPRAHLQYQMSDRHELSMDYSTTVVRPGINYLNPASVGSPIFSEEGNPNLVSSRTQNLGLTYSFTGEHLTFHLAPIFIFSNDGITNIESGDFEERKRTYGNRLRYRSFQVEQFLQWRPFSSTTFVLNNNIQYDDFKDNELGTRTKGWSDTYSVNIRQVLPWKLYLSVGAQGQIGRRPTDIYTKLHSWYSYFADLQRSFFKNECLTVRLGMRNVFDRFMSEKATVIVPQNFVEENHVSLRGRQFSLSVSYRFGALKSKVKKADRGIENDDVIGGITMSNEDDEDEKKEEIEEEEGED